MLIYIKSPECNICRPFFYRMIYNFKNQSSNNLYNKPKSMCMCMHDLLFPLINYIEQKVALLVDMSEWLRRQTWNLLGFARAGSNPAVDVFLFLVFSIIVKSIQVYNTYILHTLNNMVKRNLFISLSF